LNLPQAQLTCFSECQMFFSKEDICKFEEFFKYSQKRKQNVFKILRIYSLIIFE